MITTERKHIPELRWPLFAREDVRSVRKLGLADLSDTRRSDTRPSSESYQGILSGSKGRIMK